jgi:hypothetical protein
MRLSLLFWIMHGDILPGNGLTSVYPNNVLCIRASTYREPCRWATKPVRVRHHVRCQRKIHKVAYISTGIAVATSSQNRLVARTCTTGGTLTRDALVHGGGPSTLLLRTYLLWLQIGDSHTSFYMKR